MFSFNKRATPAATHSGFSNSLMASAANSSRAANDVQRELVRVAFKDTLRATGVPSQWLDCEVYYIPTGVQLERVQIHLVMKKWSGHLLRYSQAFQSLLLQCLDRYEPHVDHSKHEWLWKYAAQCETPFPAMPEPEEWAEKMGATYAKVPAPAPPVNFRPAAAAPVRSSGASIPAGVPKEFDLRDVFSDLKSTDLPAR